MPPRPTVISFDCADTLVRNGYTPHGFARQCAERVGLHLPAVAYATYVAKLQREITSFWAANLTRNLAIADAWWDQFVREWLVGEGQDPDLAGPVREAGQTLAFRPGQTTFPLFDDTVSCLRELQNSGYRLIVISNWDLTLDKVLTSVGIDRFFEQTFASLAFGIEKPEPGIFEIARAAVGVPAERILHIGDNPVDDSEGARAFGMQSLLLDRTGTTPGALTTLADLPRWLASTA
jgi:putative hydrolase of the HAD superfamily